MSLTDIAVIVTIAAVAAYPAIAKILSQVIGNRPSEPRQSTKAEWRQGWVHTLITLQTELEDAGEDGQSDLCRQLIWELLGGDSDGVVE